MDFSSLIKKLAPMLATTLAAPLGPLAPFAGMAVSAVMGAVAPEQAAAIDSAKAEGGTQGAIAKIAELFQQGAINAAQIKQAEQAHTEKMAELGYKNVADLEALANADRASARGRDTEITKAGRHNWRADVLAYLAIGAIGFLGYALLKMDIPPANREMLIMLIGALVVIVKDIYGFEFSTTRDSQGKTETLSEIAKAP